MKTSQLLAAAVAATFAGVASADIIMPGTHALGASEEVTFDLVVTTGGTGFAGFDITGITGNGSWASDVAIFVDGVHVMGGFNDPAAGASTLGAWDFDGSGSTDDGTYLEGTNGVAISAGAHTFTVRQAWDSAPTTTLSNIRINGIDGTATLVPEPGSLALLGLGGLALLRRRR